MESPDQNKLTNFENLLEEFIKSCLPDKNKEAAAAKIANLSNRFLEVDKECRRLMVEGKYMECQELSMKLFYSLCMKRGEKINAKRREELRYEMQETLKVIYTACCIIRDESKEEDNYEPFLEATIEQF